MQKCVRDQSEDVTYTYTYSIHLDPSPFSPYRHTRPLTIALSMRPYWNGVCILST